MGWESRFLVSGLSLLDVVADPAHQQDALLVIIEGVGGPGISVTGLPHGANIHGIAFGSI